MRLLAQALLAATLAVCSSAEARQRHPQPPGPPPTCSGAGTYCGVGFQTPPCCTDLGLICVWDSDRGRNRCHKPCESGGGWCPQVTPMCYEDYTTNVRTCLECLPSSFECRFNSECCSGDCTAIHHCRGV